MAKAKKSPGRPKATVKRNPLKVKRTRNISEEQREALRDRMVQMRKKRKPAEYKNIYPGVLAKPDNDKLSMKNVKGWIKESKDAASAHAKNSRGRGVTPQAQAREMALSESKKAYVRMMEHYLRTGDWVSNFMGANENEKTQWKCIAMAYNSDGTPKRTVGVWYPDTRMIWTEAMENGKVTVDMFTTEETFDPVVSITDTNFRNNESNLIA